jgi:hypothetical protein
MSPIRFLIFILVVSGAAERVSGAAPALVELRVGDRKLEGKIAARNGAAYWLLGQDGRLSIVKAGDVETSRQLSPKFQGWTTSIVKDQLRREFTRPFDIASSRHYVVVAGSSEKARRYVDVLEEFFSTYQMYFSLRGFKVPEPEFPLIAIVFPNQDALSKYALKERQRLSKMVRGYYMPSSNRISFYESGNDNLSLAAPGAGPPGERLLAETRVIDPSLPDGTPPGFQTLPAGDTRSGIEFAGFCPWDSVEGSLKDTLIHEATHQAAYNTGLHSRIGENPLWMVEGLATVFEAPGVRSARANTGVKTRVNRERLVWFGNFVKDRRKPRSLEAFIARDDLFGANVLDAYSQAWALTFFLFETRPRNYASYLRTVAARNPLEAYGPEARVADFKRTISSELNLLEAEFLRFMAELR